ncbi:MAG: nucleotidyltransferase family protein [Patescibacteria group bacterium]
MPRSYTIEAIKHTALPILQQAGVIRSSLFGSYVRGEGSESSDIDFLIEVPRGTSLFDLADLQLKLEQALGKNIDVVTYRSLHPLLKDRILTEQVRIL